MSKRLLKNVSFRDNEAELRLLDHANSKRNFSEWVKQRLEEDMLGRIEIPKTEPVVDPVDKIVVDDKLF